MFNLKPILLIIYGILAFSEANFVDTITKCSVEDGACQAALITSSLKAVHKTGIPELDIPPTDPLELKDMRVTVADLVELTIIEGKVTGVKDCVVNHYKLEIEKGHAESRMTCKSFAAEGKYKLSSVTPLLKTISGGETVSGTGYGKIKIEKIKLRLDFYFSLAKSKEGDVIIDWKYNKTKYEYDILGKVEFAADNIFVGNRNASKEIMEYMNANGKFVVNTFGKPFLDKAMQMVYYYFSKFFKAVPPKYYFIEDLTKYLKT